MSVSIPTPVQEAAAAIVRLIHSKPQSPRVEEIEAVIARGRFQSTRGVGAV